MKFEHDIGILCVDDDELDILSLKRCFRRLGFKNPVFTAGNGLEALDLLRGPTAVHPRPQIILLDLNMPRMDGHEFLDTIRADPELQSLSVFVLTTSDHEGDVDRAHARHVAGYLVKEAKVGALMEKLRRLQAVWEVMKFPPITPSGRQPLPHSP